MGFCKFCGHQLVNNATFCASCGNKIGETMNQQGHQPLQQPTTNPEYQQYYAQPQQPPVQSQNYEQYYAQPDPYNNRVKSKHSFLKGFIIVIAIITVLLVGVSVYYTYFVDGPDQVVEKLFDSYKDGDISGMIECLDPKTQKQFSAATSLFGNVLGEFTGFDIELQDVMDLSPLLLEGSDNLSQFTLTNVVIESYSGGKLLEFLEDFNIAIPGIEKALADEAEVTLTIETSYGETQTETITVKNYGSDGWLISGDMLNY